MDGVAWAVTALVVATALVLAEAVRRRDGAAVVNAAASLAVAVVGVAGAAGFRSEGAWLLVPELAVWAAVAGLLHSIGMLGIYDSMWWWDHVTHTVSAALVAALAYAGVLVTVGETWPPLVVAATTVAYTFVAGVFWELVELVARGVGKRYDIDPVLVHYGWRDTALDLAFDVVGAVAVVALDVRWFVPLVADAPATTRLLLLGTTCGFLAALALAAVCTLARTSLSS